MTLCSFPGSLLVLTSVVRVCWQEDEAAVTATPVYHPFFAAPENQGRELKRFPMSYEAGAWQFPMNALERASAGNSRLLMLCNPFNPIGRTLTQTELEAIVDISVQNDLLFAPTKSIATLCLMGGRIFQSLLSAKLPRKEQSP